MIKGEFSYMNILILIVLALSVLTTVGAILSGLGFFIVVAIINLVIWVVILYLAYRYIAKYH